MQIKESYQSSVAKYGKNLTDEMKEKRINPRYFLSVGRFHNEVGTPIETLSLLFKQWNTYVIKNNKYIDVSKLSFDEFRNTLNKYKMEFGIPNKVYDDGKVSIGRINSHKDVCKFPVKNTWCIKQPNMFKKYIEQGYSLAII